METIREETGVAKQEAVSRLLEWFAEQSDDVKIAILTRSSDVAGILARNRLAEMAAAKDGANNAMTLDEAIAVLKLATERVEVLSRTYADELREKLKSEKKI